MAKERTVGWWLGWSVALLGTLGFAFFTSLMLVVFTKPHAFGNRDGQGAAGLAALMLVAGLVGGGVFGLSLVLTTIGLHRRKAPGWLRPLALGLPVLAVALGVLLALVG